MGDSLGRLQEVGAHRFRSHVPLREQMTLAGPEQRGNAVSCWQLHGGGLALGALMSFVRRAKLGAQPGPERRKRHVHVADSLG